ncbi:hypothetical protein K0T92_03465 [Paenibacillus oenotherae]|uniref:Uncharacterized protein n=1 Tax=Paenibacillus oenotherae TaxID=1435645 RepID=A0ABS7D1X2_9BACL|nr:hypothetical protein [Paenibacillus oenotherae]MBW7473801.1 hypothetical protein [Paenibacillus oenotherae]
MSKKLPMSEPFMTSWQWHANLLSILSSYGQTSSWIFSNYIHLFCEKDLTGHAYVDVLPMFPMQKCPWVDVQTISRKTLQNMKAGILELLISSIDDGCYVYGMFDLKYIKRGENYARNKRIAPHDLFISGYDAENEMFYVNDFIFDYKYSQKTVPYHEIVEAYEKMDPDYDTLNEGKGGIQLVSFNAAASYGLDAVLVKESLHEYLHSKNPTERNRASENPRDLAFGLEVYASLAAFLESLKTEGKHMDSRPLHVLVDHKEMMIERIKFLDSNGFLRESEQLLKLYQAILDEFLVIRNTFIKATIKGDRSLLDYIISKLDSIVSAEKEAVQLFIDNLLEKQEVTFVNNFNGKSLWWDGSATESAPAAL